MPPSQAHGRNAKLLLWEPSGSIRDISGDLNSVVLTWTRDNPDVTTFGNDSHQRIAGLRDATLTGAYVWNACETCGVPQVLDIVLAASAIVQIQYAPGGSITGCPNYTACMLPNSHSHTAGVNAPVVGTFAFQLASGSVTAGSCA